MRIAIDIQGLQTAGSRHRGIGQYTYHLLKTMLEIDHGENEFFLLGNSNLALPEIQDLATHRYVTLEYPKNNQQISEIVNRLALLGGKVDIFHVASPMETDPDVVIPPFDETLPFKTICTLYDIIPYIFQDKYLSHDIHRERYMYRLNGMINADHIFSISECTMRDAIQYLGIGKDKITNIMAGVSPFFQIPLSDDEKSYWRTHIERKFGIDSSFIFCTGGADWRKNLEGLIKAFSKLPASLRNKYQLVITCALTEQEMQHYNDIGSKYGLGREFILTNFVSQEELRALYSLCTLFVFPSLYEGFGLPVAEAMSCGAPVIAANDSSLPEVVGKAGILVDPGSTQCLRDEIIRVLMDDQLRTDMSRLSLEQGRSFTWEKVAARVLETYRHIGQTPLPSCNFRRHDDSVLDKPRIALFSPVNPIKSGISDYTEELLPYLSAHFYIDLYLDSGYQPTNSVVTQTCQWYDHQLFEQQIEKEPYLVVLYQLGNSSYHAYMIDYILKYGGILTLHDYGLGGLVEWLSSVLDPASPNRLDLWQELCYGYGTTRADAILRQIHLGDLAPHELVNENVFLNKRFFDRSISVIVHNEWSYEMAKTSLPDYPVESLKLIRQGVPVASISTVEEKRSIRQRLGIAKDTLVIAAFGVIFSTKRVIPSVKAFAKLARKNNKLVLFFVGECPDNYTELFQTVNKLDLTDRICITGHVDFNTFYDYMKICDIVLNLRFPTNGETSASLLRAMSLGKPAIVSNGGFFSELPDDIVLKVIYGQDDEDDILEKLGRLVQSRDLRESIGSKARDYVLQNHSLDRISEEYVKFIFDNVQEHSSHLKLVADLAGMQLGKSGVKSNDHAMHYLAVQAIQSFSSTKGSVAHAE
jgi:glycosyltransferase involved in cell wall biosynthesis